MMTKQALEQMVNSINCTDKMIRLGVDHRRDFPPRGRLENAELLEKDGDFYVEADIVEYENTDAVDWHDNYIIQYFDNAFQFAEVEQEESLENSISIDPHNFNSFLEAKNFSDSLKANPNFTPKINFHGRKSEIPDPEIIFKFATAGILYQILKPTAKKLGEKVADAITNKAVEEAKKLSSFVEKSLKELFYRCVPKARPVTIVFDLPGKPHIELIARTRDEKLVLKGLREKKLEAIRDEIDSLSKNVKIAKAQFILTNKGNWKFNYLITEIGQTIGTKEGIKKREHQLEIMSSKQKKNGR
ncbi:hypothetical protein [Adhaeribacter aerolatus]|nr:hypothetical protein [Adhaeribacter aerolatus]